MSKPQSAILPEPPGSSRFLILKLRDRKRHARTAAKAAARIPALTEELAGYGTQLLSSVGFGRELWDLLSPKSCPKRFRRFKKIEKGSRRAPASGGDLLLHVVARRPDLCFDLAMAFRRELGGKVKVMGEVEGFRYRESRDLTGFIDGTENPTGDVRAETALIGDEDPEFAGGSLAFTQRYLHDLAKWERLAVTEQEKVIGRTKPDSVELPDAERPDTAHISRVVIEEDGQELEILRHSVPYGTTSEHGLFFIAYTKDLGIPTRMLERMIGTTGDRRHDHLMKYSRAVSGANFFAPSLEMLRGL
jgi:putative iron-dependent peroxidase